MKDNTNVYKVADFQLTTISIARNEYTKKTKNKMKNLVANIYYTFPHFYSDRGKNLAHILRSSLTPTHTIKCTIPDIQTATT